jgi:hypothetical protein
VREVRFVAWIVSFPGAGLWPPVSALAKGRSFFSLCPRAAHIFYCKTFIFRQYPLYLSTFAFRVQGVVFPEMRPCGPEQLEIHGFLFEVKNFLGSNYLDKPLFGCYTALRTGETPPFLFVRFPSFPKSNRSAYVKR